MFSASRCLPRAPRRFCAGLCRSMSMSTDKKKYSGWTPDQLVARVTELEKKLRALGEKCDLECSPLKEDTSSAVQRNFNSSKYSTRYIALKFAYLGKNYNGFEYHANNKTLFPTIEEEIWKALMKARLIFPSTGQFRDNADISWDGCDYSKCGRTDRGVSAFGQVIGIRVRSNRPLPKNENKIGSTSRDSLEDNENSSSSLEHGSLPSGSVKIMETGNQSSDEEVRFHSVDDEIQYPKVLNRILPPDIRILAWCPDPPPSFSARFSCSQRQYRYFFTQPSSCPTPESMTIPGANIVKDGWLDINRMKSAAKKFEGHHDFRNFCKLDPTKQIREFRRTIHLSEIRELEPELDSAAFTASQKLTGLKNEAVSGTAYRSSSGPLQVYQFVLHGSAFLWHQVRHMVAILFLIGQGLESPEIIDHLLNIHVSPQKPRYEMAAETPLVLWNCSFSRGSPDPDEDTLNWVYASDIQRERKNSPNSRSVFRGTDRFGPRGLVNNLWQIWREKKIDEILASTLLNVAASQGKAEDLKFPSPSMKPLDNTESQKVFTGGNSAKPSGRYMPVMSRPRQEPVEVVNARYAQKKGIIACDDVVNDSF